MKGKYDREFVARQDEDQTIFVAGQVTERPRPRSEVVPKNERAMCPFCFYVDRPDRFIISTRKGFHKGLGQCPHCQMRAQWKTLNRKWTAEEYAEWVYAYKADGFWQRINFNEFKKGLQLQGWTAPFWLKYNALKSSGEDETYLKQQESPCSSDMG